jgi:hypothetical protein
MEHAADQHRIAGNAFFAQQQFDLAIAEYTKAIVKCPEKPVYWMNRAVSHSKMLQWEHVLADSTRALERELTPKAHYYVGLAMLELLLNGEDEETLGRKDVLHLFNSDPSEPPIPGKVIPPSERKVKTAIAHLRTSHHLASQAKSWPFAAEVLKQLNRAHKALYSIQCVNTVRTLSDVEKWTWQIVNKQREVEIEKIKLQLENAQLKRQLASDPSATHPSIADPSTTDCGTDFADPGAPELSMEAVDDSLFSEQITMIHEEFDGNLTKMHHLFSTHPSVQNLISSQRPPIPDYLLGKISFTIMSDPVVSKSGITYDRQEILEHIRQNGFFDPLTRQTLQERDLVPNLALKEVIDEYLLRNGWAAGE